MVEEAQVAVAGKGPMRRKVGHKKKGGKARKNMAQGRGERGKGDRVKVDAKMKKLFRKRARNYNSDDDEEEEDEDGEVDISERAPAAREAKVPRRNYKETENETSFGEEAEDERDAGAENEASDGEDDEIQPGVTRFTEGCRAFRMAFKKIIKKTVSEDSIGPVLSAHKKLIAEKLAEDENERKTKGDAKKVKHLAQERGHVKPANYLDAHEKFLIGVATKGVVKLFNAVNKAQNAQKGLNPSRTKDAKTLNKRRKEAFFSEIGKRPGTGSSSKASTSSGGVDGEGPAWAPLRDNYMLTNSKLKDWDKMQNANVEDDGDRMSDSSSEDDD